MEKDLSKLSIHFNLKKNATIFHYFIIIVTNILERTKIV